jgi:hypothetical protein
MHIDKPHQQFFKKYNCHGAEQLKPFRYTSPIQGAGPNKAGEADFHQYELLDQLNY